ncbi:hypothetical protein REPUB_Repub04eG0051700 [Reevesia pubescens]
MNPLKKNDPYSQIILGKQLIYRDWDCHLQHVYREANMSADILASLAKHSSWGFHELAIPPHCVYHVMKEDLLVGVFIQLV